MITGLLLCALGMGPALGADEVEPMYMADLGLNVELPKGWTVPRWSDWDLDALDDANTTQIQVTSSNFQVEPSEAATEAWAQLAIAGLEAGGHSDPEVVSTAVETIDGRPTGVAVVRYKHRGKDRAVLHQRSFTVRGKVAHVRSIGLKRNESRVRRGLATWDRALSQEKGPVDLTDRYAPLVSEAGFSSTLPEGWRLPLIQELGPVRELGAKVGQGKIDKELCWVAIHPYPEGETAMLLACQQGAWVGRVDDYSFDGKQEELNARVLGSIEVGSVRSVPTSPDQRVSPVYSLSGVTDLAVQVGVTPFDQGLMTTYVIGKASESEALAAALEHVLGATTFSGPDGGAHPVSFLDWTFYAFKYRPILLAPGILVLLLVLVGAYKLGTRKPSYEHLD